MALCQSLTLERAIPTIVSLGSKIAGCPEVARVLGFSWAEGGLPFHPGRSARRCTGRGPNPGFLPSLLRGAGAEKTPLSRVESPTGVLCREGNFEKCGQYCPLGVRWLTAFASRKGPGFGCPEVARRLPDFGAFLGPKGACHFTQLVADGLVASTRVTHERSTWRLGGQPSSTLP